MQPKYYGAAAQYNKPTGGAPSGLGTVLKILGIFVGAIILIAIAFSVITEIGKGPQNDYARLVVRMINLQALLDDYEGNIRNSDLKTINATALLLVEGDTSLLDRELENTFDLKEIPAAITAAEDDPSVGTTLKNATLTGTFDKVYIGVLRDMIAANYDLAQSLSGAGGKKAQEAVKKTTDSLAAIDSQLAKLQL